MDTCEALLRFGGLGHTCVIYSTDDARIREYGLRMPAFRVLVNTPAPQGSTGITTNIFPSMTLGCGAMAGNITSDNVGPQHLINIKRLAYAVRTRGRGLPDPADTMPRRRRPPPRSAGSREPSWQRWSAIWPARGSARRTSPRARARARAVIANVAAQVVDRFLVLPRPAADAVRRPCRLRPLRQAAGAACRHPHLRPAPPAPGASRTIVDFVCEDDVREAMKQSRKIYIGPKTIVTPAARELAERSDILVLAQR